MSRMLVEVDEVRNQRFYGSFERKMSIVAGLNMLLLFTDRFCQRWLACGCN
jgi:hypothetical protein